MGSQILEKLFWTISNVGGNDNVPPTCCLRSVHVPAYVAVYAEATGRPESGGIVSGRVFGQVG